jgi:hypothetical protein
MKSLSYEKRSKILAKILHYAHTWTIPQERKSSRFATIYPGYYQVNPVSSSPPFSFSHTHLVLYKNNNNNNNNNNSILYYLCAESTATRPITDTELCRYR